jgi:hypothetical protein
MKPGKATDDFKVTELFRADVHQEIFAVWIFAIKALDGILHRGRQLAVCATKLLKQHLAEARIGFVDPDGVHKLFDVMIHGDLRDWPRECRHQAPRITYVPILILKKKRAAGSGFIVCLQQAV